VILPPLVFPGLNVSVAMFGLSMFVISCRLNYLLDVLVIRLKDCRRHVFRQNGMLPLIMAVCDTAVMSASVFVIGSYLNLV
jgi:hypothetical protein